MAKITHVTKAESNYRIYGAPTGYFDDFYEEKQRRFMAGVSDASRNFFTKTATIRDTWHGEAAIAAGKAALVKIGSNITHEDIVRSLVTLDDFRTSRSRMQAIILAHPKVTKGVKRGTLAGWGIDSELLDGDYLTHVMDGVVVEDLEEGTIEYTQRLYIEEDETVERLTHEEQVIALESYDRLEELLEEGLDPTSAWG